MNRPTDTYGIVPRGVTVARVKPFDFQVRTIVDYDPTFMQDRVISEIFVNGHKAGPYAVARVDDTFTTGGHWEEGLQRALEAYSPDLERMVVDEFMGLGYRKRVRELEDRVAKLHAHINRRRWWQVRRWLAERKAS